MQQTPVRLPESHRDLLERPLFAHFATVAADGSPRVNPMWFLWDDVAGVVKLTHTNQRFNYRYLKENPRVALSITDPDDQYRYVQVRGHIEKVEDDPTGAFYQVLQQRYRGHTTEVKDRAVRVVFTIRPTAFKVRPVYMTATFDSDTLRTLDQTYEVDIETSRADGAPVHRVTIWIVVDGDAVYVRSVRGPTGRWYRELQANPRGAIHVGDRRIPIQSQPGDDAATIARVSDALTRKYGQRWPGPLASMLLEPVLPTTLRVEPAA